jgi:hypothetical protein
MGISSWLTNTALCEQRQKIQMLPHSWTLSRWRTWAQGGPWEQPLMQQATWWFVML